MLVVDREILGLDLVDLPPEIDTSPAAMTPAIASVTTIASVTLQWVAPTTWIDNSPLSLSEISGYHVYYGTSATDTPNTVNINDGSATQYTITLPTGSYYFRISSISNNGVEGPMSTAIQTTIQ